MFGSGKGKQQKCIQQLLMTDLCTNIASVVERFLLKPNCWFSHEVTKIQTKKLSILPRFYFHDILEQLKTNCHTNFRFQRILGFVIEYA